MQNPKFPRGIDDESNYLPIEMAGLEQKIAAADEVVAMIFMQGAHTYNELGCVQGIGLTRADFLTAYVAAVATIMAARG